MKRFQNFLLIFCLIAILSLISCAPPLPLPTPETDQEICASATFIPVPSTKTPIPPTILTHYFILIDRSGSYYASMEEVINLIEEILQPLLRPGDRLTMAWISSASGRSTENIFDGIVPIADVNDPEDVLYVAPPPLEPDLLEMPVHKPGTTMHEMQETATAEAILLENQRRENQYNCEVRTWNNKLQEIISSEEAPVPANGTQPFIEDTIRILENAKLAGSADATDLYGALWDVSQTFSVGRGAGQYQRFKLVIFSDLLDTQNIRDLPINLRGVDILVAWFQCGDPIDCNRLQHSWDKEFRDANVSAVDYLRERESSKQNLISLLSR